MCYAPRLYVIVASEVVGLAVAAHLAPVGYSSACLGLIALLPAYPGLQPSLERLPESR